MSDAVAIARLVDYLKFPTVHPDPDYSNAVKFLLAYATELNLKTQVVELHKGKPIVVATWPGSKRDKNGSIMLNSHMDVVPVDEDKWTYPPFEAKRVDGKIYARGSQDDKVLGVIYMETIRGLQIAGFQPERTVHVTFVPEEEIGGKLGMELFVKSDEFAAMNVAFVVDEGLPSPTDELPVYYTERSPWWLKIQCRGTAGHGLQLNDDTAGEKLWRITDKLMRIRESEKVMLKMAHPKEIQLGEMISINLTMFEGGKQPNVLPTELTAVFDVRIPPTIDLTVFEQQLTKWCQEAAIESGGAADSISYSFFLKGTIQAVCDVRKEPAASFWSAMRGAIERCSLRTRPTVFSGTTDCRFLRAAGIPALGFSPLTYTTPNAHGNDENISESTFLNGIKVFTEILRNISCV